MAKKTGTGMSRVSGLAAHCRTLPGTTEDIKWGNDLIFSIAEKMYAGFDVRDGGALSFRCDDIEFERLTRIDGIIPAPYMARFGWVSVTRAGVLAEADLKKLIRRSYDLVVERLPARVRAGLAEGSGKDRSAKVAKNAKKKKRTKK